MLLFMLQFKIYEVFFKMFISGSHFIFTDDFSLKSNLYWRDSFSCKDRTPNSSSLKRKMGCTGSYSQWRPWMGLSRYSWGQGSAMSNLWLSISQPSLSLCGCILRLTLVVRKVGISSALRSPQSSNPVCQSPRRVCSANFEFPLNQYLWLGSSGTQMVSLCHIFFPNVRGWGIVTHNPIPQSSVD